MRFCYQGPSLVVHAPAKLNLFLEVLGRRPDGYHELETVMVSIGLYDTLLFSEGTSQQTRLRCHPAAPGLSAMEDAGFAGEDNLVHRAARMLREHAGCGRGVTIDLFKRIPLQAGLGGGSSDAAAAMVGLNRYWNLGLSREQLHELAARLGSDVNFFLDCPRAAIGRGRGEQITPLAVGRSLYFVVVCPEAGLSTAEVFRHWAKGDREPQSLARFVEAFSAGSSRLMPLHNALEAPARRLNADVSRSLETLEASGASPVLMSGSGSSCFAICRSARHARSLARRQGHLQSGRVFAATMQA